jgi:hypothetical protein
MVVAWNPKTVCGSVGISVSLVAMLIPGVKSTDVVAGVALKLIATFENVIDVEGESTMRS